MKQQEAWKEERERGISKMIGLLKFITCGSVDDGKSTLIGHILYDSKLLYTDQEEALELDSKVGSRGGKIDYSLLLDGLMAEREQGITIDVAYRYFTTEKRSFIVADTPGHEEYTRNMAVGASFADLAVILIDASQGVLVQTRRHARICALMGIRHFVFAVNKMDLVKYDQETFRKIEEQIKELQEEGVMIEALQEAVDRDVDLFDLICHVAFDQPPLTRKERANNVKKRNYFTKYGEQARRVLETLLDKYTDEGVTNLESLEVLKVKPLADYGSPMEIINKFGNKENYLKAIKELEEELYKIEA
jgi:small GTP-binding protein